MNPDNSRRLLIIGGRGALGSALIDHFKSEGYFVASVDRGQNSKSHFPISLEEVASATLEQQVHLVNEKLEKLAPLKFHGILCVAGGWAGGNVKDSNFLANVDLMWKQNMHSSLLAACIATNHLAEGGVLVLTGAYLALTPTPGMIAYGLAKAGVHHLVKSLASEESGLPEGTKIFGILPITLDTPNNRKCMPGADTGTWTPLNFIASLLQTWIENDPATPLSGSLVSLLTHDGNTTTQIN
ncbi:dihydropteridine reductase [Folsomia candida]|uniref:Dihydropteridine reductase n=1 Tax=Folsomia candida TaxID=158441 RepID=A0A226DFH8_FOLCA|nr:dihydropteridine reductase [Folsomia candida]OXA42956.1 Dihydropteridine reductase [Folsomia candida]